MQIRHGAFTLDVPETWSDESTLLFVGPAPSAQIPGLNDSIAAREAVSVRFFRDTRSPSELLKKQADEIRRVDPSFRPLEESDFRCPLGAGRQLEQRVTLEGRPVHQIAVAIAVGPVRVLATAAALEHRFPQVKAELAKILGSMRAVAS